jgi:hypothetical protein
MLKRTTAKPTKNFFVNLFTQDIDLEGAIFDLIDNSIDGANRSLPSPSKGSKIPKYKGKWVHLTISEDEFSITDNCGGIPEQLIQYAFRFGRDKDRPEEEADTVGIYGIGMKRSMYRIGTAGQVVSRNSQREFEVNFSEDWTRNDDEWDLEVATNTKKKLSENGTCFKVEHLRPEVKAQFSDPEFVSDLKKAIVEYYSYIIKCGLVLKINEAIINPLELVLHIDQSSSGTLKPHVFELSGEDVNVFGVVGVRPGRIVGEEGASNSRELSGITVVCNDRVVLYCNKDWRTGWGEAPVPHFHNQFIGISGIVMFTGKADAIPMATDKRQLKLESDIFAASKVSIKKGIKRFTEMTNKWKGREKELRETVSALSAVNLDEVKALVNDQKQIKLRRDTNLEKFFKGKAHESAARIPEPSKSLSKEVKITFNVNKDDYDIVADDLFEYEEALPGDVGKKCFDNQLVRSQMK